MSQNLLRSNLKELINVIREYGSRIMSGLSSDDLIWKPSGTDGRTIRSYFTHIINAEIYWLKSMNDDFFVYVSKDTPFLKMMEVYRELGIYLCQKVSNSPAEELLLKKPIFEKEKLIQTGTLSWMIWRTSLHAVHHFAQIAYIRYCFKKPPESLSMESKSWGEVMDSIIFLCLNQNR